MNKNKIIFGIIGVFLLGLIIWGVSLLNKSTSETKTPKNTVVWGVNIWIVGDDKTKFSEIVSDFKASNKTYASTTINIESFSNYADYYNTLASSFIAGKSPDVFVLNNNEQSVFLEQVDGISPTEIDPNNFKKWFQQFFWDDLVKTTTMTVGEEEKKVEFLVGVPVGYEVLWMFYNKRYINAKDVVSWASISSAIKNIKEKGTEIIPLAMWDGSTVPYAEDIITQFFMLDGLNTLEKTDGNKMKQGLSSYMTFWDPDGDNAYNKATPELKELWKNALDLFSREEVAMVAGYPRMLKEINQRGFKKNFLFAAPFPNYFLSEGKTLVNYNYFVANKNSRNLKFAQTFVKYLSTESAQKKFLTTYPYYLPALISLESDVLSEKIDSNYPIILKDFLREDTIRASYDKGLKSLYDEKIIEVLNDEQNYTSSYEKFKKNLICQVAKITKFQNLSSDCK